MRRKIYLKPQQTLNGALRLHLDEHDRAVIALHAGDTELCFELGPRELHAIEYFAAQCKAYAMEKDAPRPDPVRLAGYVAEIGQ